MSATQPEVETKQPSKLKRWLKRFGFGAFLFFLIKGLFWIVLAILAYYGVVELADEEEENAAPSIEATE